MHKILFTDLGNVVLFFDRRRVASGLHALIPAKSIDDIDQIINKSAKGIALLEQFETSEIASEHYREEIEKLLGAEIPAEDFWRAHTDLFTPNIAVLDLWKKLRAGGEVEKIIAVTDTDPVRLKAGLAMVESCGLTLDGAVASCAVGHRKPHPAMFSAALAAASVPASQCIFVDDNPAYTDAAAGMGIHAVCYRAREADAQELLFSELRHLGLSI